MEADYSLLTEFSILFLLSWPFWQMLLLSMEAKHTMGIRIVLLLTMAVWVTFIFIAIRTEFDRDILGVLSPARPLLYLLLAGFLGFWFRHILLGSGVSQHLLISFQLVRPIGMVFVLETMRGTMPGMFAHPAGWGDLLVGLLAAYVLIRYWKESIPTRWVLIVAIVGIVDFISAFFFGFTTSSSPVQLFSFDNPNTILEYPTGLIPLLLVPTAVIAHILSLSQLAQDKKSAYSKR